MEVGDEERASDDKDEGAVSEDDDDEVVENLERDDLDLERRGLGRRKRKHSPEAADGGEGGPVDPLSDLYAVLEGSALVPFLETKLQVSTNGRWAMPSGHVMI